MKVNSPRKGLGALGLALGVITTGLFSTSPAEARPYWCGNVRYNSPAAEKAICDNPNLWNLDDVLNTAYDRALYDSPAYRREIRRTQKRWLRRRNRCRASVSCIRNSYNNRIYQLEGYYNN